MHKFLFANWYKRAKYLRAQPNKFSSKNDWWNWRFALDMFMANYYERNADRTKQSEYDMDEIPWNDETEEIMRDAFGFWIRTIPDASPYKHQGELFPGFKNAVREHVTTNYGFDPFDDESTVDDWVNQTKDEVSIPTSKELEEQWNPTPTVEELEEQWNPKGKTPGV